MSGPRALAAALVAAILLSCAASPGLDRSGNAAELRGCRARGGTIGRSGMLRVRTCVIPYADAGRACTDSGQCAGRCLLDDNPAEVNHQPRPVGSEAAGRCEPDNRTFGCHSEVLGGRIASAMCVD